MNVELVSSKSIVSIRPVSDMYRSKHELIHGPSPFWIIYYDILKQICSDPFKHLGFMQTSSSYLSLSPVASLSCIIQFSSSSSSFHHLFLNFSSLSSFSSLLFLHHLNVLSFPSPSSSSSCLLPSFSFLLLSLHWLLPFLSFFFSSSPKHQYIICILEFQCINIFSDSKPNINFRTRYSKIKL